ncbi:hypothetical protein CRUP_020999 [Coryphaenoides rupestris]|nr:hypothetical protein CRUP_020999 [Coryphaenoides rupestris]
MPLPWRPGWSPISIDRTSVHASYHLQHLQARSLNRTSDGTDEDAVLMLLTARSNSQRQEIKEAYKKSYKKDLVSALKSELEGLFESLIVALMTPPVSYDASLLRKALKVAPLACYLSMLACYRNMLSCYLSMLACYLNMLSCYLNMLSCYLNMLSCYLNMLSCYLSMLACYRNMLSCYLSMLSCYLNMLSCYLNMLSCYLSMLACYLSMLACYLNMLSCYLNMLSCYLNMLSCYLNMLTCYLNMLSCYLNMLTCYLNMLACYLNMLSCYLNMLTCYLNMLSCYLNMLSCYLNMLTCYLNMLACYLNMLSCYLNMLTCYLNMLACYLNMLSCYLSMLSCYLSMLACYLNMLSCYRNMLTELKPVVIGCEGAGTDDEVLVEILASRSGEQMKEISRAYKKEFGGKLEKDIMSDTSGHYEKLLLLLLQGNREEGVNEGKIEKDAKDLFEAGASKMGTDEEVFISILGKRSHEHLRQVFTAYKKLSGTDIEESCAGTDDGTLIRVMVSRSEVDLLDIREAFCRTYKASLHNTIKEDTKGDYGKALLYLCGGNDAIGAF